MKRSRSAADSSGGAVDLATLIAAAAPTVAIFDLDSTLWNGNCEGFTSSHIVAAAEAVDPTSGRSLKLFPDVASIFAAFASSGIPIAIASASPAAQTAAKLLRGFGLNVAHAEVHPGSKDAHLRAIAAALNVNLSRALFYDDLPFNIKAANALGVGAAILVRSGLCHDDVRRSLKALRERGRGAALMRSWMAKPPAAAASSSSAAAPAPVATEPAAAPVTPAQSASPPETAESAAPATAAVQPGSAQQPQASSPGPVGGAASDASQSVEEPARHGHDYGGDEVAGAHHDTVWVDEFEESEEEFECSSGTGSEHRLNAVSPSALGRHSEEGETRHRLPLSA